jgi:hypothetical protein
MSNKLEGEGSYEATRRYNAGVRKTIAQGKVGPAAEKAKLAVEKEERLKGKGKAPALEQREPEKFAKERAENEGMAAPKSTA